MTNERAIELLHRLQDEQFDGIHGDERREALDMAVRALEQNLVQESGGLVKDLVKDCISRKMAIDALCELPSAQPERKKGRWIKLDMHAHIADHKCTACGQECYVPTCMGEPMYTYCPNCGSLMVGESE